MDKDIQGKNGNTVRIMKLILVFQKGRRSLLKRKIRFVQRQCDTMKLYIHSLPALE